MHAGQKVRHFPLYLLLHISLLRSHCVTEQGCYGVQYVVCLPCRPLAGDIREIDIEKTSEQLGITIGIPNSRYNKGVFVSTVNDNSLASQVGLQVGKHDSL